MEMLKVGMIVWEKLQVVKKLTVESKLSTHKMEEFIWKSILM